MSVKARNDRIIKAKMKQMTANGDSEIGATINGKIAPTKKKTIKNKLMATQATFPYTHFRLIPRWSDSMVMNSSLDWGRIV